MKIEEKITLIEPVLKFMQFFVLQDEETREILLSALEQMQKEKKGSPDPSKENDEQSKL